MNTSQLIQLPSAPAEGLSSHYVFLDTKQVVADMKDQGYEVANFRFPKARTTGGLYGLHEVDFRRPEHMKGDIEEVPRVVFLNSYNGSRKAQLISGIFRLVCTNGLVAGEAFHKEKFIHLGDYATSFMSRMKEVAEETEGMFETMNEWKQIRLSDSVILEFTDRASKIRYGDDSVLDVDPVMVAQPRRSADVGKDLWRVFNRVQENLVKGGVPAVYSTGVSRPTQGLKEIMKSNKFNADLWNLAEEFAH